MRKKVPSPIVTIEGKEIGGDKPTYIIAEMSANHGRDFERAADIVYAAKDAGADAVKLQTYTADTLTLNCSMPPFYIPKGPWAGQTLYQLYEKASTPWDWFPRLKEIADKIGITLFSTPFDGTAVDFLEKFHCPAYKIASYELIEDSLLEKSAKTSKPLIISTGKATLSEIDHAIRIVCSSGAKEIILLKCTSEYPAPPEKMNLKTISHMKECFNLPIGLSDHSLGIGVSVAAVALGACVIEKHFILDRKLQTPDSFFSMLPKEFSSMVKEIRMVEKAVGNVEYALQPDNSRRGLWASHNIKAGEILSKKNIKSCRPGAGVYPCFFSVVDGKRAASDLIKGMPVTWNDVG
jgi:pseudaminic acid synthase